VADRAISPAICQEAEEGDKRKEGKRKRRWERKEGRKPNLILLAAFLAHSILPFEPPK
jgi:hypothetical protein